MPPPMSFSCHFSPLFHTQRSFTVHQQSLPCFDNLGTFDLSSILKFLSVSPSPRSGSFSSTPLPLALQCSSAPVVAEQRSHKSPNLPRSSSLFLFNRSPQLNDGIPSSAPYSISDHSCDVNKCLFRVFAFSSRDGSRRLLDSLWLLSSSPSDLLELTGARFSQAHRSPISSF